MTVKNVIPKHLEAISAKLLEIGCEVEEFDDAVQCGFFETTAPYTGNDATVSWFSDGYAATDRQLYLVSLREQVP